MRYLVALVVAFAVIGLGVGFVWSTRQALHQKLRAELQAMAARGEISQAEADAGEITDMGMELPEADKFRIGIADLLVGFSFVLIPLLVVLCLGVAVATKPRMEAVPSAKQQT